jgi:heat shock protein HtpX
MSNQIRTTILLATLTGLILLVGRYFGGNSGMVVAFFFAVAMNMGSYWFSDKIVLRLYRARELAEEEAPEVHGILRRLSQAANLPMPRVYLVPSESPTAFATGRNPEHAVVAVTSGILRLLDRNELEGVLAHELSHIRNRDILVGSIAATLAGAIMMLASMARWAALFGGFSRDDDDGGGLFGLLFLAILAPLAATIIQLAISRSREYLADSTGAHLAGTGVGLARALDKLHSAARSNPLPSNPATGHMFIINPVLGKSLSVLFSTHPPAEERIRRLRAMP